MAFFACGTRDKLNARSAGATRHFVDDGSLFGTGLIFSRCKALLVRVGLGRLSFEGRFWDMPENLPLSSHVGREVVLPCGSESLRLPTRKASQSAMRSRGLFLWLGRRDSNPQQPAPKTGVLPLNYVPVWVLHKSNSFSLPNLRGHRKRHRAGVPRASGRHWQ